MIENIHLWKAERGTYFDRNVNIISWIDEYKIYVGNNIIIGMNSMVVRNITEPGTYVGLPSKKKINNEFT